MGLPRWPVHPEPIEGEALSSWLRRIGRVYGCSVADLLKYGLGFEQVKTRGLDMDPPSELLTAIAERTGWPAETIQRTTFAGAVPFLVGLSHTDPFKSSDFDYCSVLFEGSNRAQESLAKITEWFRRESMRTVHGCRQCLADYPDTGILLSWGLSVVLSCPVHRLMLESGRKDGKAINWVSKKAEDAPELVCLLDSRSMAAVVEGFVQLPGGFVSAAQWFSTMETILRELNAWFLVDEERFQWQLRCWKAVDYFPHGPFRKFMFNKSSALLIATAIDQMEQGAVKPMGKHARVFLRHEPMGEKVGLVQSTSE